jgi:hypothetical protein
MDKQADFSRRGFLGAALVSALGAAAAAAEGKPILPDLATPKGREDSVAAAPVRWGRLQTDAAGWCAAPQADLAVIQRLCQDDGPARPFDFGTPAADDLDHLRRYPFLFAHGQTAPNFSAQARANLREPDVFYRAMRGHLRELLPGGVEQPLSAGHELFRCRYELTQWPHFRGAGHAPTALYHNGRMVAIFSAGDLHCAWAGYGDDHLQEQAIRMMVNIYTLASRP